MSVYVKEKCHSMCFYIFMNGGKVWNSLRIVCCCCYFHHIEDRSFLEVSLCERYLI